MGKKETIYIMIDKYDTDDGGEIFRVVDYYDKDSAPPCSYGSGGYSNEYQIDDDINGWKEDYNIIIKEDYR